MPEYTFLIQLDGRRSIAEAVGRAAVRLGPQALSEHEALALCHWAMESQLAQPLGGEGTTRIAAAAARHERQRVRAMANPLCVRIPLIDPDRLLSRIVPWCGWVFTWPALAVWIGMVGYALYLAGSGWAAHRIVGRRDPRPRQLAPSGRGMGAAQGPARDGPRSGVQTLWRNRRLGGNHASVLHAAGLCRCHVVVALSVRNGSGSRPRRPASTPSFSWPRSRRSFGRLHRPALCKRWP